MGRLFIQQYIKYQYANILLYFCLSPWNNNNSGKTPTSRPTPYQRETANVTSNSLSAGKNQLQVQLLITIFHFFLSPRGKAIVTMSNSLASSSTAVARRPGCSLLLLYVMPKLLCPSMLPLFYDTRTYVPGIVYGRHKQYSVRRVSACETRRFGQLFIPSPLEYVTAVRGKANAMSNSLPCTRYHTR